MREHHFLCGLSDAHRNEYGNGNALWLDGPNKNVNLHVDALRNRLAGLETERLTDFVEIASYVFAADRMTGRGGTTFKNMGEAWRRNFRMTIAVRNPVFWTEEPVCRALTEALGFLSDDSWTFDFVLLADPPKLQTYFNLVDRGVHLHSGTSIVLFSGGLDSLAGAVHELRTTNRQVVLVSHRNVPIMGQTQGALAKELQDAYGFRVKHAFVDHSLSGLVEKDQTQRTRSFFFAAIAIVAAQIEVSDRILFYENGIMSVNLPISGQVVGTKASRSTHPRSLQLLQTLVRQVTTDTTTIDNPFIWRTKAEVVDELQQTPQRNLITRSISCSRSRDLDRMKTHCGVCIQCLQRRISTLGGKAQDLDHASDYRVDFLLGPREPGPDRAMAIDTLRSALEYANLTDVGFASRYSGELARVAVAYPPSEANPAAAKFMSLFRRHGKTVHELLAAALRENADSYIAKTVPENSLLRLVLNDEGKLSICEMTEVPTTPFPGVQKERDGEPPALADEIVVALDHEECRVRICDIGSLSGSAIFPIMAQLIEMHRKDTSDGLEAKNFRCAMAKQLADGLGLTDEGSIRAAVMRARAEISEGFRLLSDIRIGRNAVIENISQKGYRLNPHVRVISIEEMKRR